MASRFGVSLRSDPRKPMRSARVVSSVIRMMLGYFAGFLRGAVFEDWAATGRTAAKTSSRKEEPNRRTAIGIESKVYHGQRGLPGVPPNGIGHGTRGTQRGSRSSILPHPGSSRQIRGRLLLS